MGILLLALLLPMAATALNVDVELISRGAPGDAAGAASPAQSLNSTDGRFSVFASRAVNLIDGLVDDNGAQDVFLFDRVNATTTLVSRASGAAMQTPDGASEPSAISADGNWILFRSGASNVVSGVTDDNLFDDVFLFERATGITTLVSRSHAAPMQTANSLSNPTTISADGNWVLFRSLATDLVNGVADNNASYDVFLFDRVGGSTTLVSRAQDAATQAANAESVPTAISADGNWVLYSSAATNVIAGVTDINAGNPDVFLFDRSSGSSTLVSRAAGSTTQTANDSSYSTAISADGSVVVFYSFATDVINGVTDSNATADAFVFDRSTGSVTLISRELGSPTQTADGDSFPTAISADGLVVLFASNASNVMGGVVDSNGADDVFAFDRAGGNTMLVSRALGMATRTPNDRSQAIAISADGNWVLFGSRATDMVDGVVDHNGFGNDVFLFDRINRSTTLVSRSLGSATDTPNASSLPVALSADGNWVLLQSSATDLVSGIDDSNGIDDVFLFDRGSAATVLVSRTVGTQTQTANNTSTATAISADGNWVLFQSRASNLIGGVSDSNGVADVFLRDRASGTSILISRASGSATQSGNAESEPAAMTADGNWILYRSRATDIISGAVDSNGEWDVFLFERVSGITTLVSRAAGSPVQTPATGESLPVAISADGNRVLFHSRGSDLIGAVADNNGGLDVFLFDRASGSNTLVSGALGSATQTADNSSQAVAISADGNHVVFNSAASDVIAGVSDNNGPATDVYLYDQTTGSSMLVSRALGSATQTPNNSSYATAFSADASSVLFHSDASNLIAGVSDANATTDTFLFDRIGGATTLVSRALGSATETANSDSSLAAISPDGNWITYASRATDVIGGISDNNNELDVFLFDRAEGSTTLVSHALGSPTQTPNGSSVPSAIAGHGYQILFYSSATDVISGVGDGNGDVDVFLFDRAGGVTTLVSRSWVAPTQTGNGPSVPAAFSADGRVVLFHSRASDLVTDVIDGNATFDVFVAAITPADATTITITADLPDPSRVGEAVLIEISVTGASMQPVDGRVSISASSGESCSDGAPTAGVGFTALFSCTIWFNSSGSRTLVADFADSAFHRDSTSAGEPHQVEQATTTTIVSHLPSTTVVGEPYVVNVTVAALSQSPQGAIVVRDGAGPGSASCGALVLTLGSTPESSASCTLSSITAGTRTLTAEYIPSSGEFAASTSAGVPHQVSPAATSVSVVGPPRTRVNQPATFSFALSVDAPGAGSPVGSVTLSSGASSCSVSVPTATPSCALTFNVPGPRTIAAVFTPSDGNFLASGSSGAGNAQTLVYALSDIAVSKSNAGSTYGPGDLIVYTVTVRNLGPDTAVNLRVRDDVPAGLVNVVWSCDASGGAVCPQAGGNGDLNVLVPSLVNGGVLSFTLFGNVAGSPTQIVNIAWVELPTDNSVEDPVSGNNSATDTDVLEELFHDGFESPAVSAPMGNHRLPDAALRVSLDSVAIMVYALDDANGEALRVYARVHEGQMHYALALRDGNAAMRLAPWVSYGGEPTLNLTAHQLGQGWVLASAQLR
jgi:uncharacterized repeat protein (TIGR01451 family)